MLLDLPDPVVLLLRLDPENLVEPEDLVSLADPLGREDLERPVARAESCRRWPCPVGLC